jgi:hypothetical protein
MIYLPQPKSVSIDLSNISGDQKTIWWFDPRTGKSIQQKSIKGKSIETFTPPSTGKDWILVVDDASKKYSQP